MCFFVGYGGVVHIGGGVGMTWDEVRVVCLQKMFLIGGFRVEVNDSTGVYLAGMPFVANEGLSLLKRSGCFLVKRASVVSLVELPGDCLEVVSAVVLDGGGYEVSYYAWPERLSNSTVGELVLPLLDDVAVLLPLYMASELYKDDDNSIATVYRNEFEIGLDRLSVTRREAFKRVNGW